MIQDERTHDEIICPHCRKAFKIDEAGYADILLLMRFDTHSAKASSKFKEPSYGQRRREPRDHARKPWRNNAYPWANA